MSNTSTATKQNSAVLLISCPDSQGINATVTKFISDHCGNIIHLDQHVDFEQNIFLMRIEWSLDEFDLTQDKFGTAFRPIQETFKICWHLYFPNHKTRIAVFVSKQSHCLHDLLARIDAGEWDATIPLIISNHQDLESVAKKYNVEYRCLPITRGNKREQEQRQIELLKEFNIDLTILARYMQIVSPTLLEHFPNRMINIHHSFLPAFAGARPYHAAYARGVKIIGATSHYVTPDLDAGPIIEQDVIHISHKDTIADLIRKGRDLEKVVLARAVWHHLQRNVLVYGNKTVIFE